MEELSLTGTLTKEEKTDAKGRKKVSYFLTDEAGAKMTVPQPRKDKDATVAVKLEDFVNRKVKLQGKGRTSRNKEGAPSVRIHVVTKLEALADEPVGDHEAAPKIDPMPTIEPMPVETEMNDGGGW